MNKIEMFRKLYQGHIEREAYLATVPGDIRDAVFDNIYTNSLGRDYDMMLDVLFGDFAGDVTWFMYDWAPGHTIEMADKEYIIGGIEDFIAYLQDIMPEREQ